MKINKKQQGEAVKALINFMNDVWNSRHKSNLEIIYSVVCDAFWTASRMAGRYNLKEYDSLVAFKKYIDTVYEIEK